MSKNSAEFYFTQEPHKVPFNNLHFNHVNSEKENLSE